MNRILSENEILKINSLSFRIIRIYGMGSSCVVYEAINETDGTTHLIKEFNPRKFDLYRTNTGSLELESEDEEIRDSYNDYLKAFISGAQNQIDLRREDDITNSIANVHQLSEANGVAYVFMAKNSGNILNLNEGSLYDTLQSVKALSLCISKYHNKGLLHLDIKPENIFVYPESKETVLLFDFDSMRTKNEAISGKNLSYTKSWAAPEQLVSGGYRQISEATDLYSIGELVFYKVFGRHSEFDEHRHTSDYIFDKESPIFKDLNPEVFTCLTALFRNTLCINPKDRYQSAEELISHLDRLCTITEPHSCFIQSSPVDPEPYFVGRESEIEELDKLLDENRIVNVCGIGGIGKSEVVRNYIYRNNDKYDNIIYAYYDQDWVECITNDNNVSISNFHKSSDETAREYFERKIARLRELCTCNTLFVIDNINEAAFLETNAKDFHAFQQIECKCVFISRNRALGFNKIEIAPISDRNTLLHMFCHWYCSEGQDINEEDTKYIYEIIDYIQSHTLTLELLAKQTVEGFLTPKEKYTQLISTGIVSDDTYVVSDKDHTVEINMVFQHISRIFDISNISEEGKEILLLMTMMPREGIDITMFSQISGLHKNNPDLLRLIRSSWIKRLNNIICLHPVIAEVALHKCTANSLCICTMRNLYDLVKEYETLNYRERIYLDSLAKSVAKWAVKRNLIIDETFDLLMCGYWLDLQIFDYPLYDSYLEWLERNITEGTLTKNGDSKLALVYLKRADIRYYKSEYDSFKNYLDLACKFANTPTISAAIESDYGLYYSEKSFPDFFAAEKHLKKALSYYSQTHSEDIPTEYIFNIASLYTDLTRYDEAIKILESYNYSKAQVLSMPDCIKKSDALLRYAILEYCGGFYDDAINTNIACLQTTKSIYGNNSEETGRCLYRLSTSYLSKYDVTKDYECLNQAKEYIYKALILFEKLHVNEVNRLAPLYHAYGGVFANLNNLPAAIDNVNRAIEIHEKHRLYDIHYVRYLTRLSNLHRKNDHLELAQDFADKAKKALANIPGHSEYYDIQIQITEGYIKKSQGDYTSALAIFQYVKSWYESNRKYDTQALSTITKKTSEIQSLLFKSHSTSEL